MWSQFKLKFCTHSKAASTIASDLIPEPSAEIMEVIAGELELPWLPTSHILWLQVADKDHHPTPERVHGDVLGKATDHCAGCCNGGRGEGEVRGGER